MLFVGIDDHWESKLYLRDGRREVGDNTLSYCFRCLDAHDLKFVIVKQSTPFLVPRIIAFAIDSAMRHEMYHHYTTLEIGEKLVWNIATELISKTRALCNAHSQG